MITNDVSACDDVKVVIVRRTIDGDEMNVAWFIAVNVEAPYPEVCAVDDVVAATATAISKRTQDIWRCMTQWSELFSFLPGVTPHGVFAGEGLERPASAIRNIHSN